MSVDKLVCICSLTKIDRLGLINMRSTRYPLPLFQLNSYQSKMAEQDELPVYILYIHTLVRKIYFTNRTGEDVTLMMPTHSTDTDPLVVPKGLSCLCFCRDDIVPDYFAMFIEIYATDPQIILDIIGRAEPAGTVIYVHIKSKLRPPTLRDTSLTFIREFISTYFELSESEFSPDCLPTDLIKEICNTTRDIRPESLITPGSLGTAYQCPCRDPTNQNFGHQPYDLSIIGTTEVERLHKFHARRRRLKALESSNKI